MHEAAVHRAGAEGEGQRLFNRIVQVLNGALGGIVVGHGPQEPAAPYLTDGRLQAVRADGCPPFEDFRLYYSGRRRASATVISFVDATRCRKPSGRRPTAARPGGASRSRITRRTATRL